MATDTEEAQSPEQLEQLASQHGLSPADIPGGLGGLNDLLDLAKKLGIDPKDLLFGAKNSSAVSIVNRTKVPLYFQSEATTGTHGGFRTPPPDEIAPGATATFLSEQSDISIHTGDEQSIVYAVGDSTACLWTLHWDNPDVGDCSADQALAYPGGQVRPDGTRLEYQATVAFGQGAKTLAPFEFIVREEGFGGGGDGVVDHNSCVVTVVNHTSQSLFLAETHSDQGEFVSFPDDEIPAGASSTFQVSEKRRADHEREGVLGYARFTVTQDPGQCIWTVAWQNPESGANVASDRLDGPQAEHYQRGPAEMPEDQKENTPVRFTLRDAAGGGGTGPHPQPQPHTEPQPAVQQSDDPTLRLGDKSVDGWVEYAQQLLNTFGATLTVDGDFGHGTQQAVMTFQGQRGLLVDGVIGYQTWAALRQEDPRPPSTDGREPHTYVEQGPEARWSTQELAIQYGASDDTLLGSGTNVGNVPLNPGEWRATANATSVADGRQVQVHLTLFTGDGQPAQPGGIIFFGVGNATHELGSGEWDVFAWMPAELGGDDTQGRVTIP